MQVEAVHTESQPEQVRESHRPFRKVAVLGAGTMGSQIAAHAANAGLEVLLLDLPAEDPDRPNAIVESLFRRATKLKPDPFFTTAIPGRISLGNFKDDFDRLRDYDWIVEAVVERMDIKRDVLSRIAGVANEHTVVSTNTSGLPIHEIAEGLPLAFRRRFLGTHFFNPPRYLKLLELVPTPDTSPDVLRRVSWFGRVHLGKGIVVAKDRPYFIGNRIGIYAMLAAIRWQETNRLSIEDVDSLTGPLSGRPKSATFRTADVVGLDVMKHVIENLYDAVSANDESAEAFATPATLSRLVESGALGAKTRAGYYKKDGADIRSIDLASGEYTSARPSQLDLGGIWKAGGLVNRLRALYDDDGVAGEFFRSTTLDLLGYSARRVPEISDNPADVDRAIRWGFGWELGPFQIWDAIGFDRVSADLRDAGIELPSWVDEMRSSSATGFYESKPQAARVYVPRKGTFVQDDRPSDEISLDAIRATPSTTLIESAGGALLDIGEGVALFEFRSKANTLGKDVVEALDGAIRRVEQDAGLRGLVIANEGNNFSVGANLVEVSEAMSEGRADELDRFLNRFQDVLQSVRYSAKPVVVAVQNMALGGGCELAMASPKPVACAESYLGLVELGVGLIPAGTGTTRLAQVASDAAPNGHASEIQTVVNRLFETVAGARVSRSGPEALELGYLPGTTTIVMNADRRVHVARSKVVHLSAAGYLPPPRRPIKVLGRPGAATLEAAAYNYLRGRFISEYDFYLAGQFAFVITGGDLSGAQEVGEDYLMRLEREVFLELLQKKETQDRIEHMLKTGKPLRN